MPARAQGLNAETFASLTLSFPSYITLHYMHTYTHTIYIYIHPLPQQIRNEALSERVPEPQGPRESTREPPERARESPRNKKEPQGLRGSWVLIIAGWVSIMLPYSIV